MHGLYVAASLPNLHSLQARCLASSVDLLVLREYALRIIADLRVDDCLPACLPATTAAAVHSG
jgi:hypothetical protein